MSIRLLPQNLINQIAAGEVVERPSAAVKELIENAVDAQATRIDVKIENGGKTYFAVTDNGKGMTVDELSLAVERHATSKLPTDDLFEINFLGFRGEALPSIASVAKVCITSRQPGSTESWQIRVEGGYKFKPEPAPHPIGTTVEVRDLFYATPARLKFLKSNQSEYLSIKDMVNRIAMAYPSIHFTLSDEKRLVLNYPIAETLLQRVSQVIGRSFDVNAVPVESEYEQFKLNGFVGLPTYTRSTGTEQHLFVNGRYIKDKMLTGAVRGAYQGLIGHDTFPVMALFLSVPNTEVDVNVHPAKIEVRFKDNARIRGFLITAIRTALAENGFKTATTIGIGALEKSMSSLLPKRVHNPSSLNRLQAEKNIWETTFQSEQTACLGGIHGQSFGFDASLSDGNSDRNKSGFFTGTGEETGACADDKFGMLCDSQSGGHSDKFGMLCNSPADFTIRQKQPDEMGFNTPNTTLPHIGYSVKNDRPFQKEDIQSYMTDMMQPTGSETDFPPLGFAKAQLHKTYIVSQTQDSIIIVDQHASHERLTYERLSENAKQNIQTQLLLIPEIVNLSADETSLLTARSAELKQLGFVIEPFGRDCVAIREIPSLLAKADISRLVLDLADTIREFDDTILLQDKMKDIYARIACHGSVRAGRTMTIDEMNALLRQMEQCGTSGQCIHGRPTYIELKLNDIERLFGRTK